MQGFIHLIREKKYSFFLLILILIACIPILGILSSPYTMIAHAMTAKNRSPVSTCPSPATPTSQSLLVVLLDRSGSLSKTDPDEYSTSATKILVDFWPGLMAVILVSGEGPSLKILGPEKLTSQQARDNLKSQIELHRTQLDAFTPLSLGMNAAWNLLKMNNFPKGSRVVLITDGLPSIHTDRHGVKQTQEIEQTLLPEFCAKGIPIDTFGLKIDLHTEDGQNAYRLLKAIADQTQPSGTTSSQYHAITSPQEMATPIIQLIAQWRGLTLHQLMSNQGVYSVNIDTYARQAYIVTFHGSDAKLPLKGVDQQLVPRTAFKQYSTDTHYDFYNLSDKSYSTSGQYTVNATSDPSANVYALEDTRLNVEIISPTLQTIVNAGQPLLITTAFYDRDDPGHHAFLPLNTGSIIADFSLVVNRKVVFGGSKPLVQQKTPHDDLFSGLITPPQVGTLTITITGTVQDVPVESNPSITLQVQCGIGDIGCYWQHYRLPIILGVAVLALITIVIIWFLKAAPSGLLRCRRGKSNEQIALGTGRSLWRRLIHKSTISSSEIETHPDARTCFQFRANTHFVLKFKRGGNIYLVPTRRNTARIIIKPVPGTQVLAGQKVQLRSGSIVNIDGEDRFSLL